MSAEQTNIFPIAYGNEEETMLQVGPIVKKPKDYNSFGEAYLFVGNFPEYIPDSIKHVPENMRRHLQSGGVVYSGGNAGSANLERTTPECTTPNQFANAVEANERLLVSMVGNYVTDRYKLDDPQMARIQRRTVDSRGSGRASHDSLEIRHARQWTSAEESAKRLQAETAALMLAHIATRSFITGAGYVSAAGPRFGGKIEHITAVNKYGFTNSAYRVNSATDTGARFEIRCNDINISPWALKTRIASSAVLFVAAHTPIRQDLFAAIPDKLGDADSFLRNSRIYNQMYVDEAYQLRFADRTMKAVDFQEKIFNIIIEKIGKYEDVDEEHMALIRGVVEYCQDFREVLRGNRGWELLMDRSDVGAKFAKISRRVGQRLEDGADADVLHQVAQAWDLHYDNIEIRPGIHGAPRIEYGLGYRLRDRGTFRETQKPDEVERAVYYPPETTRAHVRGGLIRKDLVKKCEYSTVTFTHDADLPYQMRGGEYSLGPVVLVPERFPSDPDSFVDVLVERYSDNKTDDK